MPKPDDPSLLKAIQCPVLDKDIERWIRCCTARFRPLARRVAGDDAAAEDALQTAWIIVMQRLNTYRGGPPACSWVHSIVRHEAARAARPRTREEPLGNLPESAANWTFPEADAYAVELRRVLLQAIDELPLTYREVVRLRDLEERSNTEVAERLHISKQNAAVRLHRAHRLLRTRLLAHRGGTTTGTPQRKPRAPRESMSGDQSKE